MDVLDVSAHFVSAFWIWISENTQIADSILSVHLYRCCNRIWCYLQWEKWLILREVSTSWHAIHCQYGIIGSSDIDSLQMTTSSISTKSTLTSLETVPRFENVAISSMSPSMPLYLIIIVLSSLDFVYGTDLYEMSESDFRSKILMNLDPKPMLQHVRSRKTYIPALTEEDIPSSWDWRDHGAVTPVKNQEACGTCWAFSTTGNLEGQLFLKGKHPLIGLSEEFLIDCDATDCGMFGGWPYRAMNYIISRNGIPSDTQYPYCCDCDLHGPKCYPCMSRGYNKVCCQRYFEAELLTF